MHLKRRISILFVVVSATLVVALTRQPAVARIRLENICTIYGQKEIPITGIGLVVGLNGTGDGGKNLPAMRALAAALKLMNSPVLKIDELKNANNVAIVLIEARIPKTGLRRGQRIDCYVSSFMGAKSLRGGRLLVSPMETAEIGNDQVVGLATGPIYIEDADTPTAGKIPGGIVLQQNFVSLFIDESRDHIITLLLDESHSSFHSASEVARVVNSEFTFAAGGEQLAKAVGPGVVEVKLPDEYRNSPVEFVAEMLDVGIDNPHTQARVVVNAKTGVVIVTGEVEISPVIVSHKNLTVEVGGADGPGAGPRKGPFAVVDQQAEVSTRQLKSLLDALDQLRVPPEDIISIIRELHRSGKLHAAYEEF